MPPPPAEKPRLRWYQYSLRTLFLLTLFVSLLMSWYAVKMKQAMAQKKAVEAILAEGGTVQYDYQIDEQGNVIKGAKGHGPDGCANCWGQTTSTRWSMFTSCPRRAWTA